MATSKIKPDHEFFPQGYITSDGRYEIKEKLGQGGMGIVYKAFDRHLGIEVALKFQLHNADLREKAMFTKEAQAMAKLAGCMYIVSIFDVGTSQIETEDGPESIPYIAFELLLGGSAMDLVGKCREQKSLVEIKRCIKIGVQAGHGLARAHENGILHRDVKPSNLLLRKSGTIKVSDFGLVKITSEVTGQFTARPYRTPAYSAPEQLDPGHKPTIKIDIYQLGATLYHLLTGCVPVDPNVKFQSPSEINQNIPKGVSDYILKMLSERPEDRPGDCKEVADMLQRELDLLEENKEPARLIDIIQSKQFRGIRLALKEKVEKGVNALATSEDKVVLPWENEKQLWYATLLMRPYQRSDAENKKLIDRFNPIYFATYEGSARIAFSDWEKDRHLISRSLSIRRCCSGLPIRWYKFEDRGGWVKANELLNVKYDNHHFIHYFALKNVKWARYGDSETNIIKETYATDTARDEWPQAVDWDLETEGGDKKPMSQDIQTEILIPIYNPLSKDHRWATANDILGVANFEWEERFSDQRIEEVGDYLSTLIQEENCFALSEFTCDVLPNITLSDYEDDTLDDI